MTSRTLIIAEAGVNHNGSEELALQLVNVAADAGADAIKFQTFSADSLVSAGTQKAEYQKLSTEEGDQHSMLRKLELPQSAFRAICERCLERGLEFMSTPFDESAADFLISLGMQRIKIASGEITNHPFIRFLAKKDLPLVLSTGMATMDEVCEAVEVIQDARSASRFTRPLEEMLTILHCTSNYPAAFDDVHLRAMVTIAAVTELPVGYSDHTAGVAVATAAVAMGASIIEKHFTLDTNLPGPDHRASLQADELKLLVDQIRIVERALGRPQKRPASSELQIRALVRRSIVVRQTLMAGQTVTAEHISLLRPGTGMAPKDISAVVGRRIKKTIAAGAMLRWEDLE